MIGSRSVSAWATSRRSNGSRWCPGRSRTCQACWALTGSQVKPPPAICSGRSSGAVSLPSERLIAISQTLALLTSGSLAGSAIAARAVGRAPGRRSATTTARACRRAGGSLAVVREFGRCLVEVLRDLDLSLQGPGDARRVGGVVGDDLCDRRGTAAYHDLLARLGAGDQP